MLGLRSVRDYLIVVVRTGMIDAVSHQASVLRMCGGNNGLIAPF
jgi:hypothetical protein